MRVFHKLAIFSCLLFVMNFALAGNYKQQQGQATNNKTIAQIAVSDPQFSTLVTALKKANLVSVLNGSGEFTVFAPTNAAFAKLPTGTLQALLNNPEQLKKVLLYHVVKGKVMSTDIKPGMVKTMEGQDISVTNKNNQVMVNNAVVEKPDITASNGVIHVINKVMIPPSS